ncbi:amidohydrolase family protein [Embleya sp. AB8]|uniref:amidohydrolase family protein n=1 Tax=Embleya sp. AB8 TaxID=3156304 RepID=UPI003C7257DD
MPVDADLVLSNGRVLTVDAAFTVAEALAVRAGRLVAVGSDAEIRPLIGPDTEVIDLAGRTALPGINDSHLHACAFGATRPPLAVDVSHPAAGSIADVAAAARHAQSLPPDAWVIGNGWDIGYVPDGDLIAAEAHKIPELTVASPCTRPNRTGLRTPSHRESHHSERQDPPCPHHA